MCYILLTIGIYYYTDKNVMKSFLLGIIIYGVYETTSKALLENWEWKIVIIDTIWGGILFTIITMIRKILFRKI